MKKLMLLVIMVSGICFADTGTIAAGATTATFTNSAVEGRIVFLHNAAVKIASATDDTFQVLVTKGGVDYQIATVAMTTNSVYGNAVITNPVPVGPNEVFKVVRSVTNSAASVYIDAR